MELRTTPVDALDLALGRLRLMPEPTIARMAESLRRKGQLTPVVVAERDGALILVDGFVRQAAAGRAGLSALLVEVVHLDDVQMKAQVYLRNRERGLLLVEECRLVHELNRLHGLEQVEIGELLERHKSWVCRRLSLYRALSPHLRDDGSLHRLGGGSIRRLAQLPHRNHEEAVAVIERERMSPRDARLFVDLWARATSPAARQYLCDEPMEALRLAGQARAAPGVDPRVGPHGQLVVDRLLGIDAHCSRILDRIQRGVEELPPEGAATVARALDRAEDRSTEAFDAVRRWVTR